MRSNWEQLGTVKPKLQKTLHPDNASNMRKSCGGFPCWRGPPRRKIPPVAPVYIHLDRKRTQMKVLHFDRSGYCGWSKPWNEDALTIRSELRARLLSQAPLKLLREDIEPQRKAEIQSVFAYPSAAPREYNPCPISSARSVCSTSASITLPCAEY